MGGSELEQAEEALARHFMGRAQEALGQLWAPGYQAAEAFVRRESENCMEALRVLFDSDKEAGLRLLVAVGELAHEFDVTREQGLTLRRLSTTS